MARTVFRQQRIAAEKPTYQDLWSPTSGIKLAKNVQEMAVCAR